MAVQTKFGPATIDSIDAGTARVRMGGVLLRVPLAELVLTSAVSLSSPPPTDPPKREANPKASALRSLEALRFGIVPGEALERLTVGYDELRRWVDTRLPSDEGPTFSEICGNFGTGKSHMMATVRHIAEAAGYATAHVEINGGDVSLADPGRLLYHLWATVAAAEFDTTSPLVELNMRARDRSRYGAPAQLGPYPRIRDNYDAVACLREHGLLDLFEHMLEGLMAGSDELPATQIRSEILQELRDDREKIRPKRLVGLAVDDRPSDFCACMLGYAILAKVAGFKGLVLTIDEFEIEYGQLSRVGRIADLVGTLAAILGDEKIRCPLAMFVATIAQGGEDGDSVIKVLLQHSSGERYSLKPWSKQHLYSLATKMSTLYEEAYGGGSFEQNLFVDVVDSIETQDVDSSGHVRAFIKRYMAELDSRFGPPQ